MDQTGSIPFSAALFDLDGTLLDSLGVWKQVNRHFFGARHLEVPEDYSRAISGMSFQETVDYTISRFGLDDAPEAVADEWLALASDEYAHRVGLVPGALGYLRMLRRAGVRMAAVTANRPALFMPALERLGLRELFDVCLTTDDAGGRNKSDGALFRMAAGRLGARPSACAVFEDTLEGVRGARAAGMRVYAMRSIDSLHNLCEIDALADGVIDDYRGMRRYHAFPDNARRCVIYAARCEGDPLSAYAPRPGDFTLCADGGWQVAAAAGVTPDLVIGDFDSSAAPRDLPVERHPVEKDDTDTLLCLKRGLSMGFEDFFIVGGFGGRLDHTLANFQTLNYAAARGARAVMCDGASWATVLRDGQLTLPRRPGKLSVFALDTACEGVTLRGTKYDVTDITLTSARPLGMGNDFSGDAAAIRVRSGALLVLVCPQADGAAGEM
ncbi:MAG: thiamine diphosphokinase [Clostridia bacterium]|nr:thiamine diphosphokinase [Clostridia bacterium]